MSSPETTEQVRPRSLVTTIAQGPRVTLGELVYQDLRKSILSTRLPPGTPISENDLAAQTGTSRTPIREAIRRLVEERLVEVSSQVGSIVSRIDTSRARQAVSVRQIIECGVLTKHGPLSKDAIALLEANVDRHFVAIRDQDSIASAELDDEFHAQLVAACGYAEATTATRAISGDITRILFLSGASDDYFNSVATDHRRFLDLLKADQFADAVELLKRHIGGFAVDQDRLRHSSADYFESFAQ